VGGAFRFGTVFEIAKTDSGYASTPTILVSFDRADGAFPRGGLIFDANGDLFGTTTLGGGATNAVRYSKSPRPTQAMPAPLSLWSASTAPTVPLQAAA
jgi:hypothetical protein